MNIKGARRISIIIPVYNEADTIEKLIASIKVYKNDCRIIFVDGGSTDYTAKMIEPEFELIYAQKKGRANQMNAGAAHSAGDILLFLHADSRLPQNFADEIHRIMAAGNRVGCFKLKFDSKSPLMKICGFMSNFRVRFRNIAFGDQGIFITRAFFDAIGGFQDIPIMEDYQLSMDIKARGEKIALAKTKIITSERRFVQNGRLKTMAKMQKLQHMYRSGRDVNEIAKRY